MIWDVGLDGWMVGWDGCCCGGLGSLSQLVWSTLSMNV